MHPIRRFIIKVAELVAYLAIIVLTLIGGISGWITALASGASVTLGIILGALGGFVVAATGSAILFLLMDIAENTRTRTK